MIPAFIALPFTARYFSWNDTLAAGARTILWSYSMLILLGMAGLSAGIPVQLVGILALMASIFWAYTEKRHVYTRTFIWHAMAILIPILAAVFLLAIPFFRIHDGLPTGDVQKAIVWARQSLATHSLPQYAASVDLLNRDPVDFYTPGLHSLVALIMSFSPEGLVTIGLFALVSAVCVAWIASAVTAEVIPNASSPLPALLAAVFTLTQYRFLRYVREPGYHFQNLVGELLLFGMIFTALRFVRKKEKQDAMLFIACGSALFFSHQFSAFIAFFALTAMAAAFLMEKHAHIARALRTYRSIAIAIAVTCGIGLVFGYSLGLADKLPAIFTTTPHLASLLPPIADYPLTMGEAWFFAGLAGMALLIKEERYLFVAASLAILVLSRGPAIGIDIPPVRALFYLAVPFSVAAAYAVSRMVSLISRTYAGNLRIAAFALFTVALITALGSTVQRSYASLSHTVRTNSTLTAEQLYLIEQVRTYEDGGILVDDYNRRSSSWLVLSGKPMVTRIAADLERQMEESIQSPLRRALYEKQLDYEKILGLGSMPIVADLAKRNNIAHITGIENASESALQHNPALIPRDRAGDITMYSVRKSDTEQCNDTACAFLLARATLANDIGDDMDTFEHLQASIRTARLSEPNIAGNTTYRTTNAPVIPLAFNVNDYVRVLWGSQDMQLMISFVHPVPGLTISGIAGEPIPLPVQSHSIVKVPKDFLHIDEKGFVRIFIHNPSELEIPIDLIALGPIL